MFKNYRKSFYRCYVVLSLFIAFILFVPGSPHLNAEELSSKSTGEKGNMMKLERSSGWKLERLINSRKEQVPVLKEAAITLLVESDKVGGKSGCNRYFAEYKVTDNELSIGKTASTMMACPEPLMKQERDYLERLAEVKSYVIENGELHFLNVSGESVLVFSAVVPPMLTGKIWRLSSLNTGNALVSDRATGHINAEFESQGRLSGFAGCNQYSCSYRVDGEKLELSRVITTRKLCHEPENIMKTEAGFISALGSTARYSIQNDELILFNEKGKTVLIFKSPD